MFNVTIEYFEITSLNYNDNHSHRRAETNSLAAALALIPVADASGAAVCLRTPQQPQDQQK
jgi:hypothetical protein